jgi:hypothetical protein
MSSQEDTMRLVAELLDKTSGPLKDIQKSLKATADVAKGMLVRGAFAAREPPNRPKKQTPPSKAASIALDAIFLTSHLDS